MNEQQQQILPASPLASDNRKRMARLEDLYFEHKHGEPGTVLLKSVKRIGVLQTVIVFPVKDQEGKFWVHDGGRRCKAAKAAKRKEVPIRVIDPTDVVNDDGQRLDPEVVADLVTIVSNNHRSNNAVEELLAIERLLKKVGSLETVAKQLFIPLGTLRRRLRLARLIDVMREAFNQGHLAVGVAERVASLPATIQKALFDEHFDDEAGKLKLTAANVKKARQGQVDEIAAELPDSMFEGPTAEDVAERFVTVRREDLELVMQQALQLSEMDGAAAAHERIAAQLKTEVTP